MPPKEKSSKKKKGDKDDKGGGGDKKAKKKGGDKDAGGKDKGDKKKKSSGDKKKSVKDEKDKDGKKKGKKKDKKKGKKEEKESEVEELLEAPPNQGLLGNFLERYFCCRSAAKVAFEEKQREERERKAAEEEARLAAEAKAKELTIGDIPVRELRKHIRDFTKDFEANFWPPFFANAVALRVEHAAATRIQNIIRKFLGPCRRRRLEMAAFADCDEFWERKRAQKLHGKELLEVEIRTRASFAATYTRKNFRALVSAKARRDAAFLIQRAWRGYVGRRIFEYFRMLARELRIKKPPPPKSRFSSEVFKRVWGRKHFTPEKGWPGKKDFMEFDMWEHKDKPPKGNDYGLLTRKIRAAPKSERELRLLMGDKNAWVGIPVAVIPKAEARKELPIRVQAFKATTPYSVRVIKKEQTVQAPKRLTGLQTLLSLGWRNPLRNKEAEAKAQAHVVGLAGGAGSGMIPPARKMGPPNRHRVEQPQAAEVHPRHSAIEQVLRIPPDPDTLANFGLGTANAVDLNGEVFQASASFVPYYPGQSSAHGTGIVGHNHSSGFDESFVNTELNNMSSYVDPSEDRDSHDQQQVLRGSSSSILEGGQRKRQDKMKQAGPRLSTLRHDELVPEERGARKAPMGRPLRLGAATNELAQGQRSIAQVAREQEKSLLHMSHHEQLHTPYARYGSGTRPPVGTGLGAGASGQLKSVSFLTIPDQSQSQLSGEAGGSPSNIQQRSTDFSATNSQLAAGDSSTGAGRSAWQKLRDDVSTLTGSKKKFMKKLNHPQNQPSRPLAQTPKQQGKMGKQQPIVVSAEERKRVLDSRERPWPVKRDEQLHLQYSWVSQTMLKRAAEEVHAEDPAVAEERRQQEEEARAREARSRKQPPLARLSQYNDDDPTVISSLGELQQFKSKTSRSIRDERCRAQAMQHPYHWL